MSEGKGEEFLVGTSRNFILRGTFNDGFLVEVQVSRWRPLLSRHPAQDASHCNSGAVLCPGSHGRAVGTGLPPVQPDVPDLCSGPPGLSVERRGPQSAVDPYAGGDASDCLVMIDGCSVLD